MINYLAKNFSTLEELSGLSGISKTQIQSMVDNKLIPSYSYSISGELINQNFINGTQTVKCSAEYYYHKSNLVWIKQADILLKTYSIKEAKKIIFTNFRNGFLGLLVQNQSSLFNFNNLFDSNDAVIIDEFDLYFAKLYEHWLDGTFGVCVKSPDTIENIFYKEYYQAFIKSLLNNDLDLSGHKDALKNAIANYAKYVSDFSPIDYPGSSKKAYIDDLIVKL
jgi:hypothetical protein